MGHSETTGDGDWLTHKLRALLDAGTYACVVTFFALAGAASLSIATGGAGTRANIILFVVGWSLMGYAVVRLWTGLSGPGETKRDGTPDGYAIPETSHTRLQRWARSLPPVRWVGLPPPEHRIGPPAQLFLASVVVLGTSFVLEVVFGVGH